MPLAAAVIVKDTLRGEVVGGLTDRAQAIDCFEVVFNRNREGIGR